MSRKPNEVSNVWIRSGALRTLRVVAAVVCTVLMTSAAPPSAAPPQGALQRREASVDAPVLQWIQIDGDLSDWPAAMPRSPNRKQLLIPPLGSGVLDDADLTTSPEHSVCFMVGYDPKKQ